MKTGRKRREIRYKTPSGVSVRRVIAAPKRGGCVLCGNVLAGVPADTHRLAKSEKRAERVFGGMLCHLCTEQVLKLKSRVREGTMPLQDVEPTIRPYVEMLK